MKANLFRIPVPAAGALSTMPRPRGDDWLDDELAALREAGVDVLVTLQTEVERQELGLTGEAEAAARAGLEFHSFPIVDLGVPDHRSIQPLLATLTAHLRDGRHVAVHCLAGIGRSSMVAAALLVRLGITPADAWQTIAEARGLPVPETDEQREWLRDEAAGA
jgi:protein-tyrosine phosphatase